MQAWRRLQHKCFSMKIAKFLRTHFLTEHLRWLRLNKQSGSVWFNVWRKNFWSFGASQTWLSNAMLNLRTENSFDISLLFKLKYAAIWLLSYENKPCCNMNIRELNKNIRELVMSLNKPCYNDSLCLHEYTKIIGLKRKRHFFGAEKLKWFLLSSRIDISEKSQETKLLRMCKSKKSNVAGTFRLYSVSCKIALNVLIICE